MSESKIEVKIGEFSFSGQGSEAWLTEKLEEIIDKAEALVQLSAKLSKPSAPVNQNAPSNVSQPSLKSFSPSEQLSTNTIGARFGAKTCKELALCAIVHLHFFQNKESFSYDEIRNEMKTAKSFYKTSMSGSNLTSAIDGLVKDKKINECGSKQYALCASVVPELQAQIAAS